MKTVANSLTEKQAVSPPQAITPTAAETTQYTCLLEGDRFIKAP